MTYQENFDYLHFTECTIGDISFNRNCIEIIIERRLVLLRPHPAFQQYGGEAPRATLRFINANKIQKKDFPYIDYPQQGKFRNPIFEERVFVSDHNCEVRKFEIEGVTKDNPSWIEMVIFAESFELVLPEKY